ncbi:MAG: hypothetical protein CMJ18_22655 [Phycisphaeraceae bacterium]|nr:hypothetical protein [Phycisphaeraceae bacterium]
MEFALLNKRTIVTRLSRLGVRAGDHVLVHSALSSFGRVAGGADTVIDSLLEAVGPEGTVVVPTFGTGSSTIFDARKSDTGLGAIPQAFWKRPDAMRSVHPTSSVAAIGREADRLVADHAEAATAHGKGTPYHTLYELGGKILLLGVDQDRSTFLHTIEAFARLPYLGTVRRDYVDAGGRRRSGSWRHLPGPHRDFIGLEKWLCDNGLLARLTIGSCLARLMPCRALFDATSDRLKTEPLLFISDNPNLPDGVRQRAAGHEARWRRLPFELAADSGFAGRYMEQAIDNLARFGIRRIVLSSVNDVLWHQVDADRRRWYLQGLRKARIRVAALRLAPAALAQAESLLEEAGTRTAIVPSTSGVRTVSKLAAAGASVLVENILDPSSGMLQLHEALPARARKKVQLAFNPLHFVIAGEHPFLKSYQSGLKHHIGALVVNDGLASGRRTLPEEGRAEIKELLSILHARSFAGMLLLQATSARSFARSTERFIGLLDQLAI